MSFCGGCGGRRGCAVAPSYNYPSWLGSFDVDRFQSAGPPPIMVIVDNFNAFVPALSVFHQQFAHERFYAKVRAAEGEEALACPDLKAAGADMTSDRRLRINAMRLVKTIIFEESTRGRLDLDVDALRKLCLESNNEAVMSLPPATTFTRLPGDVEMPLAYYCHVASSANSLKSGHKPDTYHVYRAVEETAHKVFNFERNRSNVEKQNDVQIGVVGGGILEWIRNSHPNRKCTLVLFSGDKDFLPMMNAFSATIQQHQLSLSIWTYWQSMSNDLCQSVEKFRTEFPAYASRLHLQIVDAPAAGQIHFTQEKLAKFAKYPCLSASTGARLYRHWTFAHSLCSQDVTRNLPSGRYYADLRVHTHVGTGYVGQHLMLTMDCLDRLQLEYHGTLIFPLSPSERLLQRPAAKLPRVGIAAFHRRTDADEQWQWSLIAFLFTLSRDLEIVYLLECLRAQFLPVLVEVPDGQRFDRRTNQMKTRIKQKRALLLYSRLHQREQGDPRVSLVQDLVKALHAAVGTAMLSQALRTKYGRIHATALDAIQHRIISVNPAWCIRL